MPEGREQYFAPCRRRHLLGPRTPGRGRRPGGGSVSGTAPEFAPEVEAAIAQVRATSRSCTAN